MSIDPEPKRVKPDSSDAVAGTLVLASASISHFACYKQPTTIAPLHEQFNWYAVAQSWSLKTNGIARNY